MNENIDHLLFRLFEGIASVEETTYLSRWIEKSIDNKRYFIEFKKNWNISGLHITNPLIIEKELVKLKARIHKNKRRARISSFMKYAAIFCVLILSSYLVYDNLSFFNRKDRILNSMMEMNQNDTIIRLSTVDGETIILSDTSINEQQRFGQNKSIEQHADTLIYKEAVNTVSMNICKYNELYVPKGKTFVVQLCDGTMVHLNSNSKLYYPSNFNNHERRVRLDGEGFFEVMKNSKVPFLVDVDSISVQVYGTSFNINTNLLSNEVEIVLFKGSIGINESEQITMMRPAQRARYSNVESKLIVDSIDLSSYHIWKDGYISFEHERLEDALFQLSLAFNCTFFYTNMSVKESRITCCLKRSRGLEDILKKIGEVEHIAFEINKNVVTVK